MSRTVYLFYILVLALFTMALSFHLKTNMLKPRFLRLVQSGYMSTTRVISKKPQSSTIMSKHLSRSADSVLKLLKEDDGVELSDKLRQHVNPLSSSYQTPIDVAAENILSHLNEPTKNPVVIDVGCAKGNWDLLMAVAQPYRNFLGLEIRVPVLHLCLQRKVKSKLNNVHFMYCNANVDLGNILKYLNENQVKVECINVQFPDPQFKKRLYKRRVINTEFVDMLASHTAEGTRLFVQSDVQDVEEDMVQHITASRYFQPVSGYDIRRLDENVSPNPMQTEREISTIKAGGVVYRMLFERNSLPYGS